MAAIQASLCFFAAPPCSLRRICYVAVCSYVYIDFFGLSETSYSLLFRRQFCCAILGPILYVRLSRRLTPRFMMNLCIVVAAACGVLLLVFGSLLPLAFLLCFLPFTIIESLLRPMSTAVLLNQQEKDTGSASSLINFVNTVLGSLAWSLRQSCLAIMCTGSGFCSLFLRSSPVRSGSSSFAGCAAA